jgi:hypothetical protein
VERGLKDYERFFEKKGLFSHAGIDLAWLKRRVHGLREGAGMSIKLLARTLRRK